MKKYYAIECAPENFNYEMYYDDLMATEDNIWIGGNRDFSTTNADLREDTVKALEDAYYDIYEADDVTEEERIDAIKYYFKKENKQPLTELEIDELTNLVRMFNTCSRRDENDIICQTLTILYGKIFESSMIRGSCQGDWLEIIYPEDKRSLVPYIEAVYFATGTEFRITEEPVEESELDEADCFYDYTELWKDADIRDHLCETIGCKPEELVIRKICGEHHYVKYDYKEI